MINRLFFDIETSPNIVLSWRIGRKISIDHSNLLKERAIICIGYKWEKEKKAQALKWDSSQNDKEMLRQFVEIANKADELVGHNGDQFDLPWIRTRCLFHGIPMFPSYKTIDTLQWARRRFYFNSNRLDYIGRYLGVGGKIKTEFDLWKKVVLEDNRQALDQMIEYCKRDVEMLQDVYEKLADHVPQKTHVGVAMGKDKWTSPFTGSTNVAISKQRVTALGSRQYQMKCNDTGRYYQISEATHSSYLEWRKTKKEQ